MADQVAEIKSKVDIAQLIGERIQLKQRGRRFLALCPFHSEKTPSFTVSPELGIFKCFGCGVAGDAFTFLERYEGMSFVESLEYLADRVGVKLTRRAVDARIAALDRQILEVNHLAAEYFHFLCTKHKVGEKARTYLAKRKVSRASIDQYFIGYAPARWDALLTFLIKKGYKAELLVQAGLMISRSISPHRSSLPSPAHSYAVAGGAPVKSDGAGSGRSSDFSLREKSGSSGYDRFRGRVMFPLRDTRGQVIGFAGRILSGEKEAKYINSPETPVYTKGKHLFGIFENKDEIRKEDRAVLVEGELDAISSWQAGVRNVVAVKGTAVTSDQVKLLRRYTRNVTVALDTDEAGWDALVRSLPILESSGMNVRVVVMPGGAKDPDDMARQDPGGWRELVARAANVYDALISGTVARIGIETGEQKKRASEVLIPVLIGVANIVEQDHWIKEVSRRFGVREESVRRQMELFQRTGALKNSEFGIPAAPADGQNSELSKKKSRAEVLSRYLLALLIQSARPIPSGLNVEWLSPAGIQKIISKLPAKGWAASGGKKLRESLPEELHELFDEAALLPIGTSQDIFGDNLIVDQEIRQILRGLEQAWIKRELSQSRADPEKAKVLAKRVQELQASEG